MLFQKEYFQQIFGIREYKFSTHFRKLIFSYAGKKLRNKCATNEKLKWPILFQRFIDDGFGTMED